MTADLARGLADRLGDRSPTERRTLLVGLLNEHLDPSVRAVLVGGGAVEFYSAGTYTTGDVDVAGPREAITPVLERMGFANHGRLWVREDLGLVMEVSGLSLRATEEVIVAEVDGVAVPLIRVEDSIVDRLLATAYWKSETGWEQAVILYGAHRDRLDEEALARKAEANDAGGALQQLRATFTEAGAHGS
jgi:predicted nucleotidyltransferase